MKFLLREEGWYRLSFFFYELTKESLLREEGRHSLSFSCDLYSGLSKEISDNRETIEW